MILRVWGRERKLQEMQYSRAETLFFVSHPSRAVIFFAQHQCNHLIWSDLKCLLLGICMHVWFGARAPGDSFWEKWAYETYLLYLLEEGSRDVMMSLPKEERFWKVFLLYLHRNSAFVFMRDQKDQIIWNSISIKTLMILPSKNSLMAKDLKLILFFPWKNILTYKKIEWT